MTPNELKKAREKLGMSQPAFAKALDRSERYILYRERGERKIDKSLAFAVYWLLISESMRKKFLAKFFS